MNRKPRGLFLNTENAICSIFESGKMCYDCLVQSKNYSLDYVELSEQNRTIATNYDFYIFNYHFTRMSWLDTRFIKNLPGFKATIVLEMSQNSPFDCVSPDDFDAYIVLDPTCKHFKKNVYAFSRPLDIALNATNVYQSSDIPVIGTFGLSFSDKGFDEVIKAVNEEFEDAIIKINVPKSDNVTSTTLNEFKSLVASFNIKKGIKIEISDHYFSKEELIDWCAQNTLNVFLYNRRVGNGLSATTDQAIASGRPLAVSTNPTFRHIHTYITPYPYLSLKGSIETTIPIVKKIQQDWSPSRFILQFEEVLNENHIKSIGISNANKIKLPIANSWLTTIPKLFSKQGVINFIPPILLKLSNKLKPNNSFYQALNKVGNSALPDTYIHQALQSNSKFNEDLLIDLMFKRKEDGIYIDIGISDPIYNNNTYRFYLKGWQGINIEPDIVFFKKVSKTRTNDINLNVFVSNGGNNFGETNKDVSVYVSSKTMTLKEVFDIHMNTKQIDFMSINTRSKALNILQSNNWDKYRPSLIIIDTAQNDRDIQLFMDREKYLYLYSNNVTSIFIDKTTKDKSILDMIKWN
jgi:hypothetical protein